jgi:hypothetical protein
MRAPRFRWVALALLTAGAAEAQVQGFVPHTISLPPTAQEWTGFDAIAGAELSSRHPRGTVLILEWPAGQPQATIAEWDLQSGQRLRSTALDLPAGLTDVQMVRAGDWIHVLGYAKSGSALRYLRLTTAFEVEEKSSLGTAQGMSMATDGSTVAMVWAGTRAGIPPIDGWHVLTLDAAGRRHGYTLISTQHAFGNSRRVVVVLERHVYVYVDDSHDLPTLFRVDENAHIEQLYKPYASRPPQTKSLAESSGKLIVYSGSFIDKLSSDWFTASPSLSLPPRMRDYATSPYIAVVSDASGRLVTSQGDILSASFVFERQFAPHDGSGVVPLWVGSIPVLVSAGPNGRLWIAWSD